VLHVSPHIAQDGPQGDHALEGRVLDLELHAPDYIILLIDDLERSLTFYTQVLGLRLGHRSEEYAQLATGPTRLGLYTRRAMAQVVGVPLHPPWTRPGVSWALRSRMSMQRLPP
jgi:glyoxalase/bleomycin resistance protein/dioxygenase superfamily protein